MEFKRNLKRYMIGDDVLAVKNRLREMGYLTRVSHSIFGNDTHKAVITFQNANNLEADGIVGRLTWSALFDEPSPVVPVEIPAHITKAKAQAIALDLACVSETRRNICLMALEYAVDPDAHGDTMRCFYVRGGNLFNTDLSANVMTESKLKSYFNKTAYAPYYDGGRKELMQKMAADSGYTITGADCSGTIVGLWRKARVVKTGFDANANSLYKSYCIDVENPQAGDLCWKSGHIGLYVGGGYVVENIGGAYGCQLTKKTQRKCWGFTDKKFHTMSKWEGFGDPKVY